MTNLHPVYMEKKPLSVNRTGAAGGRRELMKGFGRV